MERPVCQSASSKDLRPLLRSVVESKDYDAGLLDGIGGDKGAIRGGPRIGNTSLLDFLLTDFAYI